MPTIKIWVSTIQHKHGLNVYAATSEEGAEENIATFCRDCWNQTVQDFDAGIEFSAEEYEKEHGRKAMIELYFETENSFGGSEYADITEHNLEIDESELTKLVKSLIADIESMQTPEPSWFGPFSNYYEDEEGGEYAGIEWPNLAISLAEVKKHIFNIETEKKVEQILAKEASIDVVAAAKRLEKKIKQGTYGWSDLEFDIWWESDPRFTKEVHTWGNFTGTQKDKCIWEAKVMLGLL